MRTEADSRNDFGVVIATAGSSSRRPQLQWGAVGGQKRNAAMAMKRSLFNELLIAEVKLRPSLWNSKCKHNRNIVQKTADWRDIANILNVSERDVQARWRNLRDTYSRKHKEELKRNAEGTATDESKEQRWIHYTQLSFLSEEQDGRTVTSNSPGEHIVPTSSGHDTRSASSLSTTVSSIVLSDVRSLATLPTGGVPDLQTIEIKKEIMDHAEEEDLFAQVPPSSPLAFPTTNTVAAPPRTPSIGASPVYHSILPAMTLTVAENPMRTPISPPPPEPTEQQDKVQVTAVPTSLSSSEQSTRSPPLTTGQKRTATSWSTASPEERKARLELDVLVIQKKKLKAELRKCEADERKAVTETLLMSEGMKKVKAEGEFFLQEIKRSEEDTSMAEALTEFHIEERKKSAAITQFYREEKRKSAVIAEYYAEEKRKAAAKADWFLEQRKTEKLRQRLLLLEIRKWKKGLNDMK